MILGVVGGTLALTQKRLHHFALAILITAMALRSARALPLCALLLLPIANAAITEWLRRKTGQEACPTSAFLNYSDNLRALDARFRGLALDSPRSARGVLSHSGRCVPRRPVSRRRVLPHPGRRAPVRPRQVRRISDLPLERNAESLLRRSQRSLRRRFPQAVLSPGTGPPGMARVLGLLPFHARAAARRRTAASRPGAARLASPLSG